jgi:predicted nucleotidyltransferase
MPNRIDKIIQQFISEVSNVLGNRLKKVILYGSYARGDYDKNSDIDIMILTDLNDKEIIQYRMKIRELACDIELENDIIISPLIRNIDKYNQRVNIIPFYMNVQKEGVVISG